MTLPDDPWEWSIDQVIEALCVSTEWWENGRPNSALPEPSSFEQSLREQEVNGSTLLTSITDQILKEDFGLKAIGRRAAVVWAIDYLRFQSTRYAEQIPMIQQNTHHASSMAPSLAAPSRVLPWLHSTPFEGTTRELPNISRFETIKNDDPAVAPANAEINPDGEKTGPHIRTGETLFVDSHGKKRRRITLPTPTARVGETPPSAAFRSPLKDGSMDASSTLKHKTSSKTSQANPMVDDGQGEQSSTSQQSYTKARNPEPTKFPVDEIFYGNTRFGQTLEDEDVDEIRHSTVAPVGVSQYVYRQVHHCFWKAERQKFDRDGKHAQTIYPYRMSLLNGDQTRSATVLRMDHGRLLATREDASKLTNDMPYDENSGQENTNHDWDYMAEKYQGGVVLPLFGDSDDEYSSSLLDEIEDEKEASDKAKVRSLSKEEVAKVIEQELQEYSQSWREKKLPLRERTARAIWRKGRRVGERKLLIAAAKDKIEKIGFRLTKLKVGILDEVYNSHAQVKDVCGALEESVNQTEEELWRISVWERKIEPPQPTTKLRSRKKPVVNVNDNADDDAGELVNSDSEFGSDGLTDFVDVDDFEGPGIMNAQRKPGEPANHMDAMRSPSPETQDHDSVLGDLTQARNEMEIDELPVAVPEDDPSLPPSSPPQLLPAPSVIDLTVSSDPPTPVKSSTPRLRLRLNSSTPHTSSQGLGARFTYQPENDSDEDIVSWDYKKLEERSDRKRIILKLLLTSGRKRYKKMKAHTNELSEDVVPDHISRALECLQKGKDQIPGFSTENWPTIVKFVKLYACWSFCKHKYFGADDQVLLSDLPLLLSKINTKQKKKEIREFYSWVQLVLTKHKAIKMPTDTPATSSPKLPTRSKGTPSTAPTPLKVVRTIEEVSDDDLYEANEVDTPNKKRRRKVEKSALGVNKRQDAQKRQQAQAERERDMRANTIAPSSQNGDHVSIMVNNTLKNEHETPIYIPSSLAAKIKTHQVEGVRFMWREVIKAGHAEAQGCLLAHTMGLGKTMQSITLLATVAQAAHSSDETIRSQIPDSLKESRTLILCPASLVPNWVDELRLWMPTTVRRVVGTTHFIAAEVDAEVRLSRVSDWYHNGGILVMSYDMLRILAMPAKPKAFGEDTREQHELVSKYLLDGPNVIIADEAHTFKNPGSKIRQTVLKFRTKSRIALTGSPLANNLEEYWSAIDWISPDYLGTMAEFRDRFVRPIQEGFYKESSKYEHRKALKKLKVLKTEIEPKVHRADITVLKNDLKSKVEFVITVPLTKLQEEAYKICVSHMRRRPDDTVTNTRVFEWISVLTLICDHPAAFAKVILKKKAEPGKQRQGNDPDNQDENAVENPDALVEDPDIVQDELLAEGKETSWISPALVKDMQDLFERVDDLDGPGFSYKTELFVRILFQARKAGDGVLVFSHRLDTLDYLERLLDKLGRSFVRLDGKTKMTERQGILSKFNNKLYDIILMSTRAGGTGFNLPGANRVVLFDFGFNPQHEEQAIGRAYRLGQTKEVFVYRLMTGGTFEAKVWNKALFKAQLATRVVDAKNPERQAEKMKDYLFDPVPVEQQDLSEHEGKDEHVLDKLLAKNKSGVTDVHIRCITTTETLMAEDEESALNKEELQEVQEMLREERLRKENPEAYSRVMQAKQVALLSTAPAGRPPQLFGQTAFQTVVQPSSTQPSTLLHPTPVPVPQFVPRPVDGLNRRDNGSSSFVLLDGVPPFDAGVNNAGPSPASMIRTLPNTINSQAPAPPSPHANPTQDRHKPTQPPGNAHRQPEQFREGIPQLLGTSQANPVELTDDDTSNDDESGAKGKKSNGPQSPRRRPGLGARLSGWLTGSQ